MPHQHLSGWDYLYGFHSAEAEVYTLTIGSIFAANTHSIIMENISGDPSRPLKIPSYTDSSTACAILDN